MNLDARNGRKVIKGSRTAALGGRANCGENVIQGVESVGDRTLRESIENVAGEIHLVMSNSLRSRSSFGGEFGTLGSSVVRVRTTDHQTPFDEPVDVPRESARCDPESSAELSQPEAATGESLEGCSLGHGHPATCDIGALGQREPFDQEPDGVVESSSFGG